MITVYIICLFQKVAKKCTLQSSAELLDSVLQMIIKDIRPLAILEGQRLSRDGKHISLRINTSLQALNGEKI